MPDEMFSFRLRFELPVPRRINVDDFEVVLHEDSESVVVLRSCELAAIRESTSLNVFGTGYATETRAEAAGVEWRSRLGRALAAFNVGANFGERPGNGRFYRSFLDRLAEAHGAPVLEDVHGLMTFAANENTLFARAPGATAILGSPPGIVEAIKRSPVTMTAQEGLAFELLTVAQSIGAQFDVRLVTLMMAVEALSPQIERCGPAMALVAHLVEVAQSSDLQDREKAPIVGALSSLRRQSARRAGRSLMKTLGDRSYGDMTAPALYDLCYGYRNRLVHPPSGRPAGGRVDLSKVGFAANHLEHVVGHLIAGPELLDDLERDDPSRRWPRVSPSDT